jgi:hypothetical protein
MAVSSQLCSGAPNILLVALAFVAENQESANEIEKLVLQ